MNIHFPRWGASHTRGLTLVEIIVVIAIITIILSIIMASISQARISTRDKKRLADLANIDYAVTVYFQKNRDYPSYPNGTEVGIGQPIDSVIKQFNGNSYADPLSKGASGETYAYWFDSDFTCTQKDQAVVFAKNMELSKDANFEKVCTSPDADKDVAGTNSYIVVLTQY